MRVEDVLRKRIRSMRRRWVHLGNDFDFGKLSARDYWIMADKLEGQILRTQEELFAVTKTRRIEDEAVLYYLKVSRGDPISPELQQFVDDLFVENRSQRISTEYYANRRAQREARNART